MIHEERATAHFVAEVFLTLRHEEEVGNIHSLAIHGNVAYYYVNDGPTGRNLIAKLRKRCNNTPLTLHYVTTSNNARYVVTLKETTDAD